MIKNLKYICNTDLGMPGKKSGEKSSPENCCPEKCPRKIAPCAFHFVEIWVNEISMNE